MGLWHCPDHGLYGGDPFCPECGKVGDHADATPPERHAWDDLKDECRIKAGWEEMDDEEAPADDSGKA